MQPEQIVRLIGAAAFAAAGLGFAIAAFRIGRKGRDKTVQMLSHIKPGREGLGGVLTNSSFTDTSRYTEEGLKYRTEALELRSQAFWRSLVAIFCVLMAILCVR